MPADTVELVLSGVAQLPAHTEGRPWAPLNQIKLREVSGVVTQLPQMKRELNLTLTVSESRDLSPKSILLTGTMEKIPASSHWAAARAVLVSPVLVQC